MNEDNEEEYYADYTSKLNQILSFVRGKSVTAKDILDFYPDSPDPRIPASIALNRLSTKGMLKRTRIEIPVKGGMYYRYELTKTGEKKCIWIKKHIIDFDDETVFFKTKEEAKKKRDDDENTYFSLKRGYFNRVLVPRKKQKSWVVKYWKEKRAKGVADQ